MLHPFFIEGDILAAPLSISSDNVRSTGQSGLSVALDGGEGVIDRMEVAMPPSGQASGASVV